MKVKIEDLKKECKKYFESYEKYITDYCYGYGDDVSDIIYQIADNSVDIYNSDLIEWVKDNSYYVEQYVKEFGIDSSNFDYYGALRGGQFLQIEETLYNNKANMLEYLAYYILQDKGIEEIEEEKAIEISMINFDNIDSITELEDAIEEIIEEESEVD